MRGGGREEHGESVYSKRESVYSKRGEEGEKRRVRENHL